MEMMPVSGKYTCFTGPYARARAFGAWSAAGGAGGMAGAVAGGAITTGLSWRWVFLINVPIGAVLIGMAAMSLAGTRTGRWASLDIAGAVTGTTGLAALIYGFMQSADHSWASVPVAGSAALPAKTIVGSSVRSASTSKSAQATPGGMTSGSRRRYRRKRSAAA